MEQNRNVDFESNVEIDSLKDAVWRLTTRVYLLEDFIAERFGEVIGPNGFTKSTAPFPGSSGMHNISNTIGGYAGSQNTEPGSSTKRKRRKSDHIGSSGIEKQSDKILKNTDENETLTSVSEENIIGLRLDFEQSENDSLLIPKAEVVHRNDNDWEANDYFLNDKMDDEEDPNDSVEKDPDFLPPFNNSVTNRTSKLQETSELEMVLEQCMGSYSMKVKPKQTSPSTARNEKSEEKKLNCSFCDKMFKRSSDLKEHARIHTGEKPFVCSECGNAFTQRSTLAKHMKTHTGEKPFVCTLCCKSFTRSSSLKTHANVVHKVVL